MNNREHIESLFQAREDGVDSLQEFLGNSDIVFETLSNLALPESYPAAIDRNSPRRVKRDNRAIKF